MSILLNSIGTMEEKNEKVIKPAVKDISTKKAVMLRPSKRAVVSFIGAGLALSPAVVTLLPRTGQAK